MAALAQARTLTGGRALTIVPSTSKPSRVSNGTKWTMKRKDSYMVEVQVGEDESEDVAVRNFMKSVVQSGVIDQLRARRYKESKIEEYKRKLQARAMARRLRIVEPTYEELYTAEQDPKAFDDFFSHDEDGEDIFSDIGADAGIGNLTMLGGFPLPGNLPAYGNEDMEMFDLSKYEQQGAGYVDGSFAFDPNQQAGGYIDQQQPAAPGGGFSNGYVQ